MAPPLVIPSGYGQMRIVVQVSGDQTAEMVFGFKAVDSDAQLLADTLAADLDTDTNISAFLPTTSTVVGIAVKIKSGAVDHVGEAALALAGVATGAVQAPQVAVLLRKHTGLAGRAYRGRTFFPQPAEIRVDNFGLLDATALSTYSTLADDLHTFIGSHTDGHYLLHTPTLDDPGPPPVYGDTPAPTLITSMTVDPKVATQRRRLR